MRFVTEHCLYRRRYVQHAAIRREPRDDVRGVIGQESIARLRRSQSTKVLGALPVAAGEHEPTDYRQDDEDSRNLVQKGRVRGTIQRLRICTTYQPPREAVDMDGNSWNVTVRR